ncbi:thiamine phosphate synthase [Akkermansiaceae bacterium]|nr:thiamine phosphate synthase [Akkermansiaceae bacterium]MDA7901101.1 thiamine phosphate synthase [bacterium]MDA7517426.1 thiamine phosphate synthase [Akkermansiaceae bacterium]MDA7519250.1 thiamine phosphate synthase [Akkermansiaceae bacterium]MDA7537771.1 thiamine phosphate synthase [Akkermansiaceae bacterium]
MTLSPEARLYGILDLGYVEIKDALAVAESLILGGASLLQLRAKGHDPDTLLDLAKELNVLCSKHHVPFIINDHVQLAKDCGAPGLHLGQDDGSLDEARAILGQHVLVGRSTHSVEQAQAALAEGADYIGFGPLFPTPTKKGRPGIGLENIAIVERTVGCAIPVFCIGGIKPANLPEVKASGAQRVVIVSHLLQAADITSETQSILTKLKL